MGDDLYMDAHIIWPKKEEKKMKFADGLNELAKDVQECNEKWWIDIHTGEKIDRNRGELLMLAVSELSEAMEGDRKNRIDDKLPQYKQFDVEVVDCLIRLLDIARLFSAPIQEIYEAKMLFNLTRVDHKHENRLLDGGKKY